MIPLGKQFVGGYYLITNGGDVYCYGDVDFFGTISSVFNEKPDIVASLFREHALHLVSARGDIFTLSNTHGKESVPCHEDIVDATIVDDAVVLFTSSGKVLNKEGKIISSLCDPSSQSTFIACSLGSKGTDIYALDTQGAVHCTSNAQHYGDIVTLGESNVQVRGMACSPWGSGYWVVDDIGGVFCFGDVDYFGSVPGDGRRCDAKKIIPSPTGRGYWIMDSRGMVLPFGDAAYCGHPEPKDVSGEIVAVVPVVKDDRQDAGWLFTQLVDNDIDRLLGHDGQHFDEPVAP